MFLGDGVGAAAKQKADRAIKMGKNITSAEQFVANNSQDGQVHYILVPVEDTYRCRELLAWFVSPRRVVGTMQVHDVMCTEPSRAIAVRKMACYQECCWDEEACGPRVPQQRCTTSELCHWGTAVLYDANVLKKLADKKKQIEKEKAKMDALERRKAAQAANNNLSRYTIGAFVACIHSDMWWVGVVEEVMAATDEYLIKFMHHVDPTKVDKCFIQFPEQDDVDAVSHGDILLEVSTPTGTICGSKWCQTLPSKEIDKILSKFGDF